MTYDEIISDVAASVGLSRRITNRIYRAYWKAVRQHITSLPLKEELTEEEFGKLQPNVNIPSIGKLYISFNRYQRLKNHYKKVQENLKAQ